MNIDYLKRVNALWEKIYPYLVSQIMNAYGRNSGAVLEIGPFSLGISSILAGKYPEIGITITDELPETFEYLKEELSVSGLSGRIEARRTQFNRLDFKNSQFDLIVFRGAFAFLFANKDLLTEIYRVLKEGGTAIVGGGFGKETPQELIDEIAEESRVLNDFLGRRRVSIEELIELVKNAGLNEYCKIS